MDKKDNSLIVVRVMEAVCVGSKDRALDVAAIIYFNLINIMCFLWRIKKSHFSFLGGLSHIPICARAGV